MSQTQAFCPRGTTIAFASAGPGTPTVYDKTIGEVIVIKRSGQKKETDDATNMASPSNYREYISTLKDGGEVDVEYNFVPADAGQLALSSWFEGVLTGGEALPVKITLPNTMGAFTFTALCLEYGNFQFPADKKATGSVKLKITGPVVFA